MIHVLLFLVQFAATEAGDASAAGRLTLHASIGKKTLEARVDGALVRRYAIAVGTKKHPTPRGAFPVRHIVWNPDWKPPKERWARGKKPTPPGHPDNPMRVAKIFFKEPDYYIHGTNDEESIGYARSHGCIRMTEDDAYELGRIVMRHGGASRSEEWIEKVFNRGRPAHVWMPRAVKLTIGS